jgi:hypothetical protein
LKTGVRQKKYYTRAESVWCLVRCWQHPENEQALVEVYMADLRKALDELAQAIQEEDPDNDMEDAIDSIEVQDAQVADEWDMVDDFDNLDISYDLTETESAKQETNLTKVSLTFTFQCFFFWHCSYSNCIRSILKFMKTIGSIRPKVLHFQRQRVLVKGKLELSVLCDWN